MSSYVMVVTSRSIVISQVLSCAKVSVYQLVKFSAMWRTMLRAIAHSISNFVMKLRSSILSVGCDVRRVSVMIRPCSALLKDFGAYIEHHS